MPPEQPEMNPGLDRVEFIVTRTSRQGKLDGEILRIIARSDRRYVCLLYTSRCV